MELTEALAPSGGGGFASVWSVRVDGGRALALGLPQDESAASIVRAYADDHVFDGAADDEQPPSTSRWASETTKYD